MSIFSTRYVYIYNEKRSKEYVSSITCTLAGARKVKKDGEHWYRVRVDLQDTVHGDQKGRPRTFFDALKRVRQHLTTKPHGTNVALDRLDKTKTKSLDQVRFRKLEIRPPVMDSHGVEGVDRFRGWVESRFPRARWAGDCVCKPLDHGDCAAVDYFGTDAEMREMVRVALEDAAYFRTKYVILYDRIYYVRSDGTWYSQHYGGAWHAHVHFSCFGGQSRSACFGDRAAG